MPEKQSDIVPPRIETIVLKKMRTADEEEQLNEWLEEDMSDDQWEDYLALSEQRRKSITGKKEVKNASKRNN